MFNNTFVVPLHTLSCAQTLQHLVKWIRYTCVYLIVYIVFQPQVYGSKHTPNPYKIADIHGKSPKFKANQVHTFILYTNLNCEKCFGQLAEALHNYNAKRPVYLLMLTNQFTYTWKKTAQSWKKKLKTVRAVYFVKAESDGLVPKAPSQSWFSMHQVSRTPSLITLYNDTIVFWEYHMLFDNQLMVNISFLEAWNHEQVSSTQSH